MADIRFVEKDRSLSLQWTRSCPLQNWEHNSESASTIDRVTTPLIIFNDKLDKLGFQIKEPNCSQQTDCPAHGSQIYSNESIAVHVRHIL